MAEKMPVLSTYRFTIDKKNRLFIPAKHREALGEALVIGPSFRSESLSIFSLSKWNEINTKINAMPAAQREEFNDQFTRWCDTYIPDAQGRVTLVDELVKWAHLEDKVVIEGVGDSAKIWNADTFDRVMNAPKKHTLAELADIADV